MSNNNMASNAHHHDGMERIIKELGARLGVIGNIFFISLVLSGCSAVRPPSLPPLGREMLPEGAISTKTALGNALIRADLVQAMAKRLLIKPKDQSVTLLALSGGGANGAFGAGVMEGWTQRGDRPDFDVVTGISTGALMAPLIFLGSKYDEPLSRLYSNIHVSRIYTDRPLAQIFKELSLKDPGPLRALIRELITEQFVEAIGREHEKGRRLFVGTTDLDLQRSVIWDIGAIATGRSTDKVPKIRDVLLASSSVPLIFPPVYFTVVHDGQTYQQMHVDGGIESPLLVPGLLSDLDSALKSVNIDRDKTKVKLFALANQQIEVENNRPVEPGMVAIAVATINHSQRSNLASNLARLQLLSKAQGVEMRVLAIPPGVRLERDSLEFDEAEMKLLYQLGLHLGGSSDTWK
jgi:predicted acylesterase/phospholipase RssA